MLAVWPACASQEARPSIWPPPDFELTVEQFRGDRGAPRVVRRVQFAADGLVVYACAERVLRDDETQLELPLFDRLCIYRLVPTCVRALARRLHRLGIGELDRQQGEASAPDSDGLGVTWQAFGGQKVIAARGRLHGPMAEILQVVMQHLPDGEVFAEALRSDRQVVSVLRGVPAPRLDAAGALAALVELLPERPGDPELVLHAFALACDLGQREAAVGLLEQWQRLVAKAPAAGAFADATTNVTVAALQRLLPPAGSERGRGE